MNLAGELQRIYDAVNEDCTIDEVAANAAMPPARVSAVLAELELDGLLIGEGGRWRRR